MRRFASWTMNAMIAVGVGVSVLEVLCMVFAVVHRVVRR